MTISLGANPGGSTLGGTLTATAYHGVAVFDGLTLGQLGNGYTLQITSTFPTITTEPFDVIANPTPWQGTFYPVPTDASLRTAINQADSDSYAFNTIWLSASSYLLSNTTAGEHRDQQFVILAGQDADDHRPGSRPARSSDRSSTGRIEFLRSMGSLEQSVNVVFQNLTIEGGNARDGGSRGWAMPRWVERLLIDDAAVTLTDVVLEKNKAQGAYGAAGAAGAAGQAGRQGRHWPEREGRRDLPGQRHSLAVRRHHPAKRRPRRDGRKRWPGRRPRHQVGRGASRAARAAPGGNGGSGAGGGIYAASGTVILANDAFSSNQAIGGPGGRVDPAEVEARGNGASIPGLPGGPGGAGGVGGTASGGAIYLAAGTLTVTASTLQTNSAVGGAGGQGGAGGAGTAVIGSITGIFGGSGSILSSLGEPGRQGRTRRRAADPAARAATGPAAAFSSQAGSLTVLNSTLAANQAVGGQGGVGGRGGTGGFAHRHQLEFSGIRLRSHRPASRRWRDRRPRRIGLRRRNQCRRWNRCRDRRHAERNIAQGARAGTGGHGGSGPLAALGSSLGIGTSAVGTGRRWDRRLGSERHRRRDGAGLSAGAGGNGGNGGTGEGGGLYVSGGAITLTNATVAANSVDAGALDPAARAARRAPARSREEPGSPGLPGDSYGGGLYVNGAVVDLDNSTVALNIQTGSGSGAGVVQVAGTVTAVSTLFGGNGAVDYSGNVTATDSLFQTAPTGTLSGNR